jgi:hypothetical protein
VQQYSNYFISFKYSLLIVKIHVIEGIQGQTSKICKISRVLWPAIYSTNLQNMYSIENISSPKITFLYIVWKQYTLFRACTKMWKRESYDIFIIFVTFFFYWVTYKFNKSLVVT